MSSIKELERLCNKHDQINFLLENSNMCKSFEIFLTEDDIKVLEQEFPMLSFKPDKSVRSNTNSAEMKVTLTKI